MVRLGFMPETLMARKASITKRGVAAIVECAGAQLPRVEVRSQHHVLVGLFAAAKLRHYVRRVDRSVSWFGNGDVDRHPDLFGQQTRQPVCVLARDDEPGRVLRRDWY